MDCRRLWSIARVNKNNKKGNDIDEVSAEVILGNFRKLPILQVIPRKKAIIKRRFVSSRLR